MGSASALAGHVALDKLFTPSLEFCFFFWEQLTACNPELSHLIRILLVWVNSASFLCGGGGRLGNRKGQAWLDWVAEKRTESYRKNGDMSEKNEKKSLQRQC